MINKYCKTYSLFNRINNIYYIFALWKICISIYIPLKGVLIFENLFNRLRYNI